MTRLVFGKRPVFELLEAGTPKLEKLVLARGLEKKDSDKLSTLAESQGVSITWESRTWLDQRCQGGNHQGVAALAPDFVYANLTEVLGKAAEKCLLVILDQV